MRAVRIATVVLVAVAAGGIGILRAIGQEETNGRTGAPPAATDPTVPSAPMDMGTGERLALVVGETFASRERAEAANAGIQGRLGHLQGFYVAPVAQFVGLAEHLGARDGDLVLVSAFRTEEGAREFRDFLAAMGVRGRITPRMENRGFVFVGLGQERAPDGSGPLVEPLPGAGA